MILNKIEYKNYRCFTDGSIEFIKDKLNIVIGENGAGKTEILFSIWWVLYDVDFHQITGKKNTPYALNSALYKQLEASNIYMDFTCSVTLHFEHEGRKFRAIRTKYFYKESHKVRERDSYELAYYDKNGVLSVPIRDERKYEQAINKILPKKILSGVLFDGERMRKLSSEDEQSIKAIEGIISDITNQDALNLSKVHLSDVSKKYSASLRKVAKEFNNEEMVKLLDEQKLVQESLERTHSELAKVKANLPEVRISYEEASSKLKNYGEIKVKEERRRANEERIKSIVNESNTHLQSFSTGLSSGYVLLANRLLDDVNALLQDSKAPIGLTSSAVEEIIKRNECICGESLTSSHKDHLLLLIDSLPPNNIDATIQEMVRQSRLFVSDHSKTLHRDYEQIAKDDHEIDRLKAENASISTEIGSFSVIEIQNLEIKRTHASDKLRELELSEKHYQDEIKRLTSELSKINKDIERKGNFDRVSQEYGSKIAFVEKCLTLLNQVEELNKRTALTIINEKLEKASSDLTPDYAAGRRLHITTFVEPKYRIVPYYLSELEKLKSVINSSILRARYTYLDWDDPLQREEAYIVELAVSNSTGQAKTSTLSFIKAILDYSKTQHRSGKKNDIENIVGEEKLYPLVLDAPFTELSEKTVKNVAEKLFEFNEQTIVLLDRKSYRDYEDVLSPHVGMKHELKKIPNTSVSTINRVI